MSDRVLEGRKIVVTGAGSGLGAAYAEAAGAAGAAVVVNDLRDDLAQGTLALAEPQRASLQPRGVGHVVDQRELQPHRLVDLAQMCALGVGHRARLLRYQQVDQGLDRRIQPAQVRDCLAADLREHLERDRQRARERQRESRRRLREGKRKGDKQ